MGQRGRAQVAPVGCGKLAKNEVLIVPPYSSVTQPQMDLLVDCGMRDGLLTLCDLPPSIAQVYVADLLRSEPVVRRKMLDKMTTDVTKLKHDHKFKAFRELTQEQIKEHAETLKEEFEDKETERLEAELMVKAAAPVKSWLEDRPTAAEWTSERLNTVCYYWNQLKSLGLTDDALSALLPNFVECKGKYVKTKNHRSYANCPNWGLLVVLEVNGEQFVLTVSWQYAGAMLGYTHENVDLLPIVSVCNTLEEFQTFLGKPQLPTAGQPTPFAVRAQRARCLCLYPSFHAICSHRE